MTDEPVDLVELAHGVQRRDTVWRRISRSFYVLRYYRKAQIARRAVQRLTPEFIARRRFKVNVHRPVRVREGAFESFGRIARCRVVHTDQDLRKLLADLQQGAVTLLHDRRELGAPIDWQANLSPRPSHLWRFHLHYHEYLLDLAAGLRDSQVDPWSTIWETIESWIAGNPLARATRASDAWHPYCISRRLPIWAQLYALQRPPEALEYPMLTSLAEQAAVLRRRLEFDLGGNHLLENLRALALAGCFLEGSASDAWLEEAERLLRRELATQILPHGEHFERAPMYHCQVLGNLLQTAIAAEGVRPSLAAEYRAAAERMLEFLAAILHPDGEIPLFGDSCFGEAHSVNEIRALAENMGVAWHALCADGAYVVGSYWVWRNWGDAVILDAGEVAAASLPAHGHCDLLGLEASIAGERLFVDSGLFGYEDDAMRRYCRSSLAHNVATADNADCCDVWSSFRMGRRGRPTGFSHGREGKFAWARASHDGYRGQGAPRLTRLVVAHEAGVIACVDLVIGAISGKLTGRLHAAPRAAVQRMDATSCTLAVGGVTRRLRMIDGASLSLGEGCYCPRFGRRERTTVIQYTAATNEARAMQCVGWILAPAELEVACTLSEDFQAPRLLRFQLTLEGEHFEYLFD